jgi:exodeoxyribonuclease VIII
LNPLRGPQKVTPARELGNALHISILEPERFEKDFVCEPDIKDYPGALDLAEDYKRAAKELGLPVSGTKPVLKTAIKSASDKYKFWDDIYENSINGKKVLSIPDWRVCKAVTHRVKKHPAASELFKTGQAEQSIFWTDKDTGVPCKGRIDWLTNGPIDKDSTGVIIVDLKSTTDASPDGFQRSVSKYRYYVQAAMYTDGLEALGYSVEAFVFAAWEKHIPYASALYFPTKEMLEVGRQEYRRLLRVYIR